MRPTARSRCSLLTLVATGLAAFAQQAPADPIDVLLSAKPAPRDGHAEEAERPPVPPAASPYVPLARPTKAKSVYLDQTGETPERPPTPSESAYDTRLKSSMASAEAFQGPLEGGWTLFEGGRGLYAIQLVDEDGAIQGAWRDLRRARSTDASGFVDEAQRTAAGLTLRFAGGVATLRAAGDGRWTGDLTISGQSQAVSLRRRR